MATESIDDTIDVLKALLLCKPAAGRRMGLMAMTGGQSVVITDAFERAGQKVPRLTESSYKKLAEFFNIINHANFAHPRANVFTSSGGIRGSIGRISRTVTTSRQIQLALKITF